MRSTLNDRRDPAEICRENGWIAGTKLIGNEGYGDTVIEITAVGEKRILAKVITENENKTYYENSWVLWCRDWKVVQ